MDRAGTKGAEVRKTVACRPDHRLSSVMPHSATPGWLYLDDSQEGHPFVIDGLDVWKHKWIDARDQQKVTLIYGGEPVRMHVYHIEAAGRQVWFAAGEVVMNGWSFCVPAVA